MAEGTVFGNVLQFFSDAGIYQVVLPFLLIFAMVFAILEKTKVFGLEEINGKQYTRKNVNSIVAFVIAFFVVGSSQLVEIILKVSSQAMIVLLVVVLAMVLIGTFSKEDEGYFTGPYKWIFMVIVGLALALIIANAIPIAGTTALRYAYDWLIANVTSTIIATILLIALIIGVMVFITSGDLIEKFLGGAKKKEE
ncbi:hypothetical protein DRJ17_01365 [Candidatus Woesearchaeota archaeon]|nr:MAG: hypothetical protein DRJ17_01365 [Candidatus Woesearchaeota archaeon]